MIYISATFIIFTLCLIGYYLPLSYDEAWHYLYLHDKSVVWIMHEYVYPNNHIFYSILHHFIPFNYVLSFLPHGIRLLNIITTGLIIVLISKIVPIRKPLYFISLFLLFITFNPLLTVYSVESRGYMLGTLLLLSGIYLISLGRIHMSAIPLTLSAYTIPTFAYVFPGLWIFIALRKHWRHAIFHMMLTSSTLVLLYFPLISKLQEHAKKWNDVSFLHFIKVTILSLFSYPDNTIIGRGLTALFICLLVFCFVRIVRRSSLSSINLLMISSSISYVFIVFLTVVMFHNNPPFERNGLFIGLFIFIFAMQQFESQKNNVIRVLLLLLLTLNTYFGLLHITSIFIPSTYGSSYMPSYPIPVKKYSSLKTADCLLYTAWEDEPVTKFLAGAYHATAMQLNNENMSACCKSKKESYRIINPAFERIVSVCKQ